MQLVHQSQVVIDPKEYFETKAEFDRITKELEKQPNSRKLKRALPDKNLNLDERMQWVSIVQL